MPYDANIEELARNQQLSNFSEEQYLNSNEMQAHQIVEEPREYNGINETFFSVLSNVYDQFIKMSIEESQKKLRTP